MTDHSDSEAVATSNLSRTIGSVASAAAAGTTDAPDKQTTAAIKKTSQRGTPAGVRADGHHKELLESHANHVRSLTEDRDRAIQANLELRESLGTAHVDLSSMSVRVAELEQSEKTAKCAATQSTFALTLGGGLLSIGPLCSSPYMLTVCEIGGASIVWGAVILFCSNKFGWPDK